MIFIACPGGASSFMMITISWLSMFMYALFKFLRKLCFKQQLFSRKIESHKLNDPNLFIIAMFVIASTIVYIL